MVGHLLGQLAGKITGVLAGEDKALLVGRGPANFPSGLVRCMVGRRKIKIKNKKSSQGGLIVRGPGGTS